MPTSPTSSEISAWSERDVLITVKASPVLSNKYHETVCVAGITSEGGWIRLYPINYRELPQENQFEKYDVVTIEIKKNPSDSRPESFMPKLDSIVKKGHLETDKNWTSRRLWIAPTQKRSMCEILELHENENISLGCFKVGSAQDVIIEKIDQDFSIPPPTQTSFLQPNKKPLELIPFKFSLRYKCCNSCNGHTQQILDWEFSELFRKCAKQTNESDAKKKVKSKILDEIFQPKNEVILYVGNHSQHPSSFMILGMAYYRPDQSVFPF
jgi:hypothetical protein